MRLYDKAGLRTLPAFILANYWRDLTTEAKRLWDEFEAHPCPEYFLAWQAFIYEQVDLTISEKSRRIIAEAAARNGPGGVEV